MRIVLTSIIVISVLSLAHLAFARSIGQLEADAKLAPPNIMEIADDITSQASDYFEQLLRDNEPEVVLTKLEEYLKAKILEGMLDSYDIQRPDIITLYIKGRTRSILFPRQYTQELLSEKVYTVSELSTMLRDNPDQLKGKDVFLRAYPSDSTDCIGCDSHTILRDCDYKEYQEARLKMSYKKQRTPEEAAADKEFNASPVLMADPLIFLPFECQTYRGHFFDKWAQCCGQDRWSFFVVVEMVGKHAGDNVSSKTPASP